MPDLLEPAHFFSYLKLFDWLEQYQFLHPLERCHSR